MAVKYLRQGTNWGGLGKARGRGMSLKLQTQYLLLSVWPWGVLKIVSSLYPQAGTDKNVQGKKSAARSRH